MNHPTTQHHTKPRLQRLWLVCDTSNNLRDENKYIEHVFPKNNYKADFIKQNSYQPTEAHATNSNPTSVTKVTIPYIKDTSWILQPYNIRIDHKTTTTSQHLPVLTNVKDWLNLTNND